MNVCDIGKVQSGGTELGIFAPKSRALPNRHDKIVPLWFRK